MKLKKKLFRRILLNTKSGEAHQVDCVNANCCIPAMKKENARYVTRRKALKLMATGKFNGCRYCWSEMDNG